MTVESNYVITIATLSDWLKRLAPFFNQWDAKPKPIAPCTRDFSRASSELQVIARNCDWFIALFVPVVIGRSNCFGFGFSTVIWKPLIVIWQAPRAGSMRRILCSDWLPEWARWSDIARPGLPVSFPQIKFRLSSSKCTKVFSRRN